MDRSGRAETEESDGEMDEARAFLEDARVSVTNLETDFVLSNGPDNRGTKGISHSILKTDNSRSSSAASLLGGKSHSPVVVKKSSSISAGRLLGLFRNRIKRQPTSGAWQYQRTNSNATTDQDSSADEEARCYLDVSGGDDRCVTTEEKVVETDEGDNGAEQGWEAIHGKCAGRVHTSAYMDGLKGQDYQVLVTVIEARRLSGLNLDPVVCVQVGPQKKYTSARSATSSPYYNEYFVFEFRMPAAVFFDQLITLTVYQSKRLLRKSEMVGAFKLDVGTVYGQPDQQFWHKWAVLTDPEDAQSGVKGYLKCNIGVCSKGQTLRVLPHLDNENDDDIESNLLLPEGVRSQRQQARYVVRIYRADGLPRVNSGVVASVRRALSGDSSVSLLDPYVEVHFAGHWAKTSVQKGTASPVWNERIVFTEMFPPLVRRMRFQLRDNAAVGNAVLATRSLDLSAISDEGRKGFLPTFGPCFVSLYGSCGDYNVVGGDRNSALNEGLGEGVCYKGRLLMSLKVDVLNEHHSPISPGVTMDPCPPISDGAAGKEETFTLFGCVFEVSMLDRRFLDKEVYLEVSMGGAGNVLEANGRENETTAECEGSPAWDLTKWKSASSHSITPSSKTVSSDELYARLPYGDEKPCVYVFGRWPDQRWRLFHTNALAKMADRLLENIGNVQLCVKRGDVQETNQKFQTMCDDFIQSCQAYQGLVRNTASERTAMNQLDKERLRMCQMEVDRLSTSVRSVRSAANRRSMEEKLRELSTFADRVHCLAEEPQDSLPDVLVWLVHQNKRVAYHRFPARHLLFSNWTDARGSLCGRMHSFYLKLPGRQSRLEDLWLIHGQVTGVFWLGLNKERKYLLEAIPAGYSARLDVRQAGHTDKPPPKSLEYAEKASFELRCHLFQARSLIASDSTGLSDPFARVVFCGYSTSTQIVEQTLNPSWDELLVVPSVTVYGSPDVVARSPPSVVVELFDHDTPAKREFIGRVIARPLVKLAKEKYSKPKFPPRLQWHRVMRGAESTGELLAAFELLEVPATYVEGGSYPPAPTATGPVTPVPEYIRPSLGRYRIEVLFWGLRDMKRINLAAVDRPRVDVEIAGHVLSSSVINSYKKNPNFPVMTKTLDMDLPDDPLYWPPLVIRCVDCRNFGRFVLVGTHTIDNIHAFMHNQRRSDSNEEESLVGTSVSVNSVVVDVNGEPALLLTDSRYASDIVTKTKPGVSCSPIRRRVPDEEEQTSLDWWSKYFTSMEESLKESSKPKSALSQTLASLGDPEFTKGLNWKGGKGDKKKRKKGGKTNRTPHRDESSVARFKVFFHELENTPEFDSFQDCLSTFDLYRGKQGSDLYPTRCVGKFKGAIRICRHPVPQELTDGFFRHTPSNEPERVLVRVYVVKATDLHPSDLNGKADPYVVVSLGKTTENDRQNYISKQLNPVFGKCFELQAVFPFDSHLCLQVFDWDLIGSDDLIGETWIDLENRFYSRHRANCGLALTYDQTGYNKWRDPWKPNQILSTLCKENNLEGPFYLPGRVRIGSKTLIPPVDQDDRLSGTKVDTEWLALYALRNWREIPKVGCGLVPEHVETRALYHPDKPGVVQGRLQLWVDMFPLDGPAPGPPVDITPRKPKSYQLRVIIWNTDEVVLEDDSVVTGQKMSDIYVKGWLKGPEDCQCTDVHYRSMTGEGNFNWRFVFPFDYLAAEDKIVISRKETMFSWDETELKIPPRLELQVWDADHFSADDFLGSLTLELSNFARGAKTAKQCKLDMMSADADTTTLNIFKQRRVKGWWPFSNKNENGELELTGKVEAELHLLTEEEAEKSPAGLGRNEPDPLDKPSRPDSSFVWFFNPLKSARYILWRNYKWLIVKILIAGTLLLLLIIFLYSIPGYVAKRMVNA